MLNQAFTKLEWDEIYVLNQAVGTKLDLNLEFGFLASPKLGKRSSWLSASGKEDYLSIIACGNPRFHQVGCFTGQK